MNRVIKRIPLSETSTLVRVFLTGDKCEMGSTEARVEQFRLLQNIASTPDLSACDLSAFQKMRMYHDGNNWVAEFEATFEKQQNA